MVLTSPVLVQIFLVTNCLFILDDDSVQVCWVRDGGLDPLQLELSIEIIL